MIFIQGDMGQAVCKLFEQELQRECEPRKESRRRHHGFTGKKNERESPKMATPHERMDIFERYPRITPEMVGKDCGDSAWARRECAATLLASRVKLAQRLQEQCGQDGDAADELSPACAGGEGLDGQGAKCGRRRAEHGVARSTTATEAGDPRERGDRQAPRGRGCEGAVGSQACHAVLAGANPSRAAKARQDKPRSRVALVLTEEERARRRRLVEIQPKVSRLSFPFSPRGKDHEGAQQDIEHRSRGGIAFTIGDDAGCSPMADMLRRPLSNEAAPRGGNMPPPRKAKAPPTAEETNVGQQSTPTRGGSRS